MVALTAGLMFDCALDVLLCVGVESGYGAWAPLDVEFLRFPGLSLAAAWKMISPPSIPTESSFELLIEESGTAFD